MSGLAVDATQPKPPLTPLTFVKHPHHLSPWCLTSVHFGTSMDTEKLGNLTCSIDTVMRVNRGLARHVLSGEPEVDPPFHNGLLVTESLPGLAVNFIPTFCEIVNVEQQVALRCLIGTEQCEQTFVVRIFDMACSQQNHCQESTVKLALNQFGPDTSPIDLCFNTQQSVLVPPLDQSLLVAVLWQVCFFLNVLRTCPNALVKSAMRPVTFAEASH